LFDKEAFPLKYWRGFLVAGILAAIAFAMMQFAQDHTALIDMVYPYMTRLMVNTLADWTSSVPFCLFQAVLLLLIAGGVVSLVLMIVLRWNPIQWLGWVLAAISCVFLLDTLLYGLNDYTGPIAEDVRLEMTDYTVSELNEATVYFRDNANKLSALIPRDGSGKPKLPEFEELALKAADGFHELTYEEAISLFAGSTAPVKKLGWSGMYTRKGVSGVAVALTGEAAVNPEVPDFVLPFAMCQQMARRMTVSDDEESKFAAYMACSVNSATEFRYAAHAIAYYHCYNALASIPTSTAQSCAAQTAKGANQQLKNDLAAYEDFFGSYEAPEGDSMADLLTSWYVQTYITPLHIEEENPFNPLDPSNVDLTYTEPEYIPLEEWEARHEEDD